MPPLLPPPGLARGTGTAKEPATEPPDCTPWPFALLRGASAGVLVALLGLVLWSVLPALLGWHTQVVLTGSMQPRIRPGDLVLVAPVRPGDLQPGRIVLFRDPAHADRTLVHRLIRFDPSGYMITKGDANRNEDSTSAPTTSALGLPRLRVPYIGLPVVWLHAGDSPKVLVGGSLLSGLAAIALWPVPRQGPA